MAQTLEKAQPGIYSAISRLISVQSEASIEYSGSEQGRWLLRLSPSDHLKRQFSIEGLIPCIVDLSPKFSDTVFSALERLSRNLGCDRDIGIIFSNDPAVQIKSQRQGANAMAVLAMDLSKVSQTRIEEMGSLGTHLSKVLAVTDHFNQSGPITNESLFFGRDGEVDQICSLTLMGQHCGVFGLRKAGKTSVLNIARYRFRRQSIPCDFLDLNTVHTRPVADTAFLFVTTCINALESIRVQIPPGLRARASKATILDSASPDHWECLLDEILEYIPKTQAGSRILIVQIDESDHLIENGSPDFLEKRRDRHHFFGELRGYIQSRQNSGLPFPALMFAGISRTLLDSPQMFGGTTNCSDSAAATTCLPSQGMKSQNS